MLERDSLKTLDEAVSVTVIIDDEQSLRWAALRTDG